MRVKKIRIKSKLQSDQDLRSIARALDEGKSPRPIKGEYFESLEAVRTVLTDKRLELWRTIRDHKPESLSMLAKLVGRSFRAVHRDVLLLETLGLVSLEKAKGKRGDIQQPISLVDELLLQVA